MRRLPGQWRSAGRPLRRVSPPPRAPARTGSARGAGTRSAQSAQDLLALVLGPATRVEGGRALKVCLLIADDDRLGELLAEVVTALRGDAVEAGGAEPSAGLPGWEELTPRELDVLDLVARGEDNRSIAALLALSDRTVRNHLNSVFSKLNVSYRPQAVVAAREAGLGVGPPRFEERGREGRG